MKQKVTAIFDIGKTNKKFFLFDKNFKEIYREYIHFDEINDEDGYPSEDLLSLQKWIKTLFQKIVNDKKYNVIAINFSSYGASFVHLDENGKILTPLYNYTKPLEEKIVNSFYSKYGPEFEFLKKTGTSNSGMLNSGMQLYWLKHTKPEIYKNIKYSLHLPQYLSYIFTGIPFSEYTSIGCHTALWDYDKKDYHQWVYTENIHKILPPIVPTETSMNMNYNGKRIKIGVGIHDSSAALLPYIRSSKKPFVLISTGTWSISLNAYTKTNLNDAETKNGCINYMRINGKPVKSSRLLLGKEYSFQIKKLNKHFQVNKEQHKKILFDKQLYLKITENFKYNFSWEYLQDINSPKNTTINTNSFEEAYHQLMIELVALQAQSIKVAIANNTTIKRLFVDGGFVDNDVYLKLLSNLLKEMKLKSANSSLGSALGAAIAISDSKLNSKFLKENYSLKKHVPFIIK